MNCSSEGIIIFTPLAAIFKPLSSVIAAISINDCSNEVSFKSAWVVKVFLKVPATVGWAVLNKLTPSPESKLSVEGKPWIKGSTAFTCFALLIDLAKAFVYLEASLSYKLSSIASSVIANAKATVSWVYLAVKVSCASSNDTPAPSPFTCALPKPDNITSSSKALSEDSVV